MCGVRFGLASACLLGGHPLGRATGHAAGAGAACFSYFNVSKRRRGGLARVTCAGRGLRGLQIRALQGRLGCAACVCVC